MRRRRGRVALLLAMADLLALSSAPGMALAADPAAFGSPTATAAYGERITFRQPATLHGRPKRVEVLVEFPGATGPQVFEVPNRGAAAQTTLEYELAVTSGSILPNTTLTARWRVTSDDGSVTLGPPVNVTYQDTKHEWQTRAGDLVRIHWYAGSDAFGERALAIGERAVRETSELLGVTEKDPIDFFVYADQTAFYDVLGPGSRENVGGQANAEIRTLFALIKPDEIDQPWVEIVIPHELTHLVFDTAVKNPYHFPPRWLNEGLAVYLSEGHGGDYRGAVEDAARDGSLIPLGGLTGQFPTTRDRFLLAYGESVSAVDYLIRTHGKDALIGLIKSYTKGLTDDEGFSAAIGIDTSAFDEAWRTDLDAKDPVAYGPKDAPPGPLPPGWIAHPAAGGDLPNSGAPGAPSAARPAETPPVLIGAGLALGAVVLVGLIAWRRRRTAG